MVTSCLRAFAKKAALRVFPAAAITTLSLGSATMACTTQYTVKDGDILTEVALDQFGSYDATEAIVATNADLLEGNPHKLEIGMQLQLPCVDKEALWSVMIDARALAKLTLTNHIQILDIRDWDDVGAGVVPGSVSLPYAMWRGPVTNPGLPPSDARLANLIGHAGLDLGAPIVIVHRSVSAQDTGQAAKTYWILKSAGAKQLAILQNGFQGWQSAGLPIAAAPVEPQTIEIDVIFSLKWRADVLDVYGIATNQITGHLLDGRPSEQATTTIPGAINTPAEDLMTLVAAAQNDARDITKFMTTNQIDWQNAQVISFSETGEAAALTWFFASEVAGMQNIQLYPESLRGWRATGGRLSSKGG